MLLPITADNWLSYQVLVFQQRPISAGECPSPPVCSSDSWCLVCVNIWWMNFTKVHAAKMLLQNRKAVTCIAHVSQASLLQYTHSHWCNLACCNFHEATKHCWTMSVRLAIFLNGVNTCNQSSMQENLMRQSSNMNVSRDETISYGDWQSA